MYKVRRDHSILLGLDGAFRFCPDIIGGNGNRKVFPNLKRLFCDEDSRNLMRKKGTRVGEEGRKWKEDGRGDGVRDLRERRRDVVV